MPETEVSIRVASSDLQTVDEALAWVVQQIDRYKFQSPLIAITPYVRIISSDTTDDGMGYTAVVTSGLDIDAIESAGF